MVKEQKLKVAEAIQDDVNKGIVRIDSSFMHNIDIRQGDIVEIEGERKTVGIADRAYPGDIGLNIIRMDGILRRNARTGIGEIVKINKADIKEAKKVVIAPAQKGILVRASPNIFKHGLLGRAVMKGDIVSLGGTSRRRSTMSDSPFFGHDIFGMIDENLPGFGFADIKFIVADTQPKQAVIISDQTEVVYNPEAIEVSEEKVLEVTYEDIGGLQDEIKKIREMVELPLKHPEIFERLGIEPPKGVLLHGSPGTGKTLLAKAVANETASNFFLINGPEIMSKFYGQSEANVRKKFEEAEKNAPSIIFIDEIDAIAPKREESYGEVERRVVAQLLAQMDGLKSRGKVVVIAATNIPDSLDPALRRPGRFDREIEIGVPNKEGRLGILKIHTRNMPLDTNPKSIDKNLNVNEIRTKLVDILSTVKPEQITMIAEPILSQIDPANRKSSYDRLEQGLSVYFRKAFKKQSVSHSSQDFIITCLDKVASEIRDSFMRASTGNKVSTLTVQFIDNTKKDIDQLIYSTVKEVMLRQLAEVTYGFVGADLASLTKEAAMEVLRRILPELEMEEDEPIPKEILEKLRITMKDFREALKVVRPSAMREVLVEIPNVTWEDVGGLDDVKKELIEAIEWPLKMPQSFKRLGVKPPKGVLIYGAPGTGKTLLARAVATESKANFIPVKGPELLSKWVGESEKAVRKIFKKARQTAPSIIFFDEVESIAPRRGASSDAHVTERVVNQILTEMDGLEDLNEVVVVAATNRPDMLDTALLRPGRFDRIVLASSPDQKAREAIFKIHTMDMPIDYAGVPKDYKPEKSASDIASSTADEHTQIKSAKEEAGKKTSQAAKKQPTLQSRFYSYLASLSEGYVGADIESVCREAAMLALRDNMKAREVTIEYFRKALDKVKPSITKDIEKTYEDMKDHFTKARGKEMEEERPNYMG